ncbi:phage recombination protein Bet, partial [Escherichia coli NE098]
PG